MGPRAKLRRSSATPLDPEFLEDVVDVVLDGRNRNRQSRCNFLVGEPAIDQRDDVVLALGQLGVCPLGEVVTRGWTVEVAQKDGGSGRGARERAALKRAQAEEQGPAKP